MYNFYPQFTAGPPPDAEAEQGARLTCHLLLRLFQTAHLQVDSSGTTAKPETRKNQMHIKSSTDKHLLDAAHEACDLGERGQQLSCLYIAVAVVIECCVVLSVGVQVRGCSLWFAGTAYGKKFKWYSYSGIASMYTAFGCWLWVQVLACFNFWSLIEFCCNPQAAILC